jgi:lambda family phage portal protein
MPQAARHRFVPASEVLHLYVSDRPGQTRGVPWLASAIQRLHQVAGYEQAALVRARASSALMGFITSPEGELQGDELWGTERVTDFQPGVFRYLAPGESVTVPQLDAPDGQLEPFLRSMLRAVASGVGCAYTTISADYSQTNYSSSRLSLLEERDNWKALQQWMIENFHQPVFEAWLEMAVLAGELNLPVYETDPDRYRNVRWFPRGWSFIDPVKETSAYKDAVRCGFKTQAEVVAEQGGDLEELLVARKAEVDRAEELDLYFDTNPENEHEQTEDPAMESTEAAQETADNMETNQIAEESDGPIA